MPKMHYFSNKFLKITKRWGMYLEVHGWGLTAPAPFNLQYRWPEVRWFDQIMVFQADCDETEL